MSTARVGREREWRVIRDLEARGWVLIARQAGSKRPADIILAQSGEIALIQVGGKGKTLGPADRDQLCRHAELCQATPVFARVVPRQGIEYLHIHRELSQWTTWTP